MDQVVPALCKGAGQGRGGEALRTDKPWLGHLRRQTLVPGVPGKGGGGGLHIIQAPREVAELCGEGCGSGVSSASDSPGDLRRGTKSPHLKNANNNHPAF